MASSYGRKVSLTWAGNPVPGVREKSITIGGEAANIASDENIGKQTLIDGDAESRHEIQLSGVTKDTTLRNAKATKNKKANVELVYPSGYTIEGTFKLAQYKETQGYSDAYVFEAKLRSTDTIVHSDGTTKTYIGLGQGDVEKLDENGGTLWTFSQPDEVGAIAVDKDGYIYTGSNDNTVRKLDRGGSQLWKFTGHGGSVRGVAVDTSGNVYTASADATVKKLDGSSGNELRSYAAPNDQQAVAVDINGNCYVGGDSKNLIKLDSDLNEVWRVDSVGAVKSISVDQSGNIFVGLVDEVRKFDSSGSEFTTGWPFTGHSRIVPGLALDDAGYIYTGSPDDTAKKIERSTVTADWTYNAIADVNDVAVDPDLYVYVAGNGEFSGYGRILKLDGSNNEIWVKDYDDTRGRVTAVAVTPGLYGAGFWQ